MLEASDGEDAVKVVEGRMSGPVLARRLLSARADLRVLSMSGYTGDARITAAGQTRHEILQKPFTPIVLARKVREVLDAPRD